MSYGGGLLCFTWRTSPAKSTTEGHFVVLDARTGEQVRAFDTPQATGYVGLSGGAVVLLEGDALRAMDARSGATRWTRRLPGAGETDIVRDDVLYHLTETKVQRVDLHRGTLLPELPVPEDVTGGMPGAERRLLDAVAGTVLIVGGALVAVDGATGHELWMVPPRRDPPQLIGVDRPPLRPAVYVSTGDPTSALDPRSGARLWSLPAEPSDTIHDGAALRHTADDAWLEVVELPSEKLRWRYSRQSPVADEELLQDGPPLVALVRCTDGGGQDCGRHSVTAVNW